MPDFRRWFRITYGFPSAVPGPPRGLQRQQSGRLCQQVRDTVIGIGFSYLAKQGAGGGEKGEHKSLWIPLYSGRDRWAVSLFTAQITGFPDPQMLAGCWLLFTPLNSISMQPVLAQGRNGPGFRWEHRLSREVLSPCFMASSGEKDETKECPYERLLREGRAAREREERGQSPGHAPSDAWRSGKHSSAD